MKGISLEHLSKHQRSQWSKPVSLDNYYVGFNRSKDFFILCAVMFGLQYMTLINCKKYPWLKVKLVVPYRSHQNAGSHGNKTGISADENHSYGYWNTTSLIKLPTEGEAFGSQIGHFCVLILLLDNQMQLDERSEYWPKMIASKCLESRVDCRTISHSYTHDSVLPYFVVAVVVVIIIIILINKRDSVVSAGI